MKPTDDRSLVWIRRMIDRHEAALLRYAAHIVRDDERARDVVQETFLRLWRDRRGEHDHLDAWLFAVCRNRALDVLRKERRMTPLSDSADARPSADGSPDAATERRETMGQVATALAGLPTNQQEVLRLKFQNEFSYKQIADVTGLSVSNVGVLIHKGIRALRDQFASAGLLERREGEA